MEEGKRDPREKSGATPSRDGSGKGDKRTLNDFFKDIKGEFGKVIWPSRRDLAKQTITVMMTSALVGAIIVVYDGVFSVALKYFAAFVSK